MSGKKWFYWLGQVHGSQRRTYPPKYEWPKWAFDAYMVGWWKGFMEASI